MSGAAYFEALGTALTGAGIDTPVVVIDRARYRVNLDLAKAMLPRGIRPRIVAKSLPSLPLLDMACAALDTNRLMTFSDEMLLALLNRAPQREHLLGKPFPVSVAARILTQAPDAATQVTWLVDTPARMLEYQDLANSTGYRLSVVIEVDVGLHRGGMKPGVLAALPRLMERCPNLHLRGLMGYEPHLAGLPGMIAKREARRVDAALTRAAGLMKAVVPMPLVNTGGSQTFERYSRHRSVNEVALGSVLVKPSDFDRAGVAAFEPAAWIATPILKHMSRNPVPGLGFPRRDQIAIWGGYWKAKPVHPAGYRTSHAFGHSSNQEVWSGPPLPENPVSSFAFLRPDQSESVLSEFGRIAAVDADGTVEIWGAL